MKKIFIIFLIIFSIPALATISDNIVNGCDDDTDFFPAFVINTYTCNEGYFLPANTLGCVPCPAGYVCPGGTFNFNSTKVQGINTQDKIAQNTNNTCSANFLGTDNNYADMFPAFIPNETITVNFNNGETTETITCVYNTELTLPETPTRVGYTFAGWKIHTDTPE